MQNFRTISLVIMLMLAFNFLLSQTFQNEVVGSEDWQNGDLVYLNNGTFVFLSEADNVLALHTIDTLGNHIGSSDIIHSDLQLQSENYINSLNLFPNGDLLLTAVGSNSLVLTKLDRFHNIIFSVQLPPVNEAEILIHEDESFTVFSFSDIDGLTLNKVNALGNIIATSKLDNSLDWERKRDLKIDGTNDYIYITYNHENSNQNSGSSTFLPTITTLDLEYDVLTSRFLSSTIAFHDLKLDSDGMILLQSSLEIIKLDADLNLVWSRILPFSFIFDLRNASSFIIDSKDDILALGIGGVTDNFRGLTIYKYSKSGDVVFSKLLLDGLHKTVESIFFIETGMLILTRSNNDLITLRKLNVLGEADDCNSFEMCYDLDGLIDRFEDLESTSESRVVMEVDISSVDVQDSQLDLVHSCAPLNSPTGTFGVLKDTVCYNESIFLDSTSVFPLGQSSWILLNEANSEIYNSNDKLPNEFNSEYSGDLTILHRLEIGECFFEDSVKVYVIPESDLLENDYNYCTNDTLSLSLNGLDVQSVLWDNGATSFVNQYYIAGNHNVQYTDVFDCEYFEEFVVNQLDLPQVTLPGDTTICEGDSIELKLEGSNFTNLEWSSGSQDSSIVVSSAGIYSLLASNECGNVESFVDVNVQDCVERIFVPNVFSPNGNSTENSVYRLFSVNVEIVSFEVFDRWGNSVYFSNEQIIEWDGYLGKTLLSKGVYTYILEYKTVRNESKLMAGTITLL